MFEQSLNSHWYQYFKISTGRIALIQTKCLKIELLINQIKQNTSKIENIATNYLNLTNKKSTTSGFGGQQ